MGNEGFIAQVRARRDVTVLAMRDAIVQQVPRYAILRASGVDLHHAATRMTELATEDAPLTQTDLEFFRAIGRQRGRERFSAAEVRTAFELSYLAGLRDVFSIADGETSPEMLHLTAHGAREHPRILQAAQEACAAAVRDAGDEGQARELLLQQLITGKPATSAAAANGTILPAGFMVLLCRPERRDATSRIGRRNPLVNALMAIPGALWRGDTTSGELLVLLPTSDETDTARAVASDLVSIIVDMTGQRIQAVQAHAAMLDAVPAAFQQAQQAIAVVAAMPDARNHPYVIDELLIELTIARQPDLRRQLAELLAPLMRGTDLLRTLEALFDCGLDRERTTRVLYIHRRTLTYRIHRIRELTGLDLTTAHGIQLLRAAVIASRLS